MTDRRSIPPPGTRESHAVRRARADLEVAQVRHIEARRRVFEALDAAEAAAIELVRAREAVDRAVASEHKP